MKINLQFSKLHGLGNDFIVIDGINQRLNDLDIQKTTSFLCNRRYGIGADGVVLALPSADSDLAMHIYNADGSIAEMCGNGLRCLAQFAYEHKLVEKEIFSIETKAGVKVPALSIKDGKVMDIEVDMGIPSWNKQDIPLTREIESDSSLGLGFEILGQHYSVDAISMGNPHAVIFVDQLDKVDIQTLGSRLAVHPDFKHGTNVEVVQIMNPQEARMLVWERGVGVSHACGTGACAVVVAGVLKGVLNNQVSIHLPGGKLYIDWQGKNQKILMTGPAKTVYSGSIEL